jgi:hypothetical protein
VARQRPAQAHERVSLRRHTTTGATAGKALTITTIAEVFNAIAPEVQMQKNRDHGVTQDDRGEDQPKDKQTAQKAGVKEQRQAAKEQVEAPGEPAGGE